MIVKLEGNVNYKMVDQLVEAHNNCAPEDTIHLYLASDGGALDDMEALISMINESDKIEVVFCYSRVYSAAFVMSMRIMKPLEFLDTCLGMAHRASFHGAYLNDNLKIHGDVKDVMKLHSKNAKKLIEDLIDMNIFTKKEAKQLRDGKDVYFNTKRLRQMRKIAYQPIQDQIDMIMAQYQDSLKEDEAVDVTIDCEEELKEETTVKKPARRKRPDTTSKLENK